MVGSITREHGRNLLPGSLMTPPVWPTWSGCDGAMGLSAQAAARCARGRRVGAQHPVVNPRPVGGVDYPRTWAEFAAWFPDDAACVAYLERLRWGDGFVCPSCGSLRSWAASRGLGSRVCAGCGRRVSGVDPLSWTLDDSFGVTSGITSC